MRHRRGDMPTVVVSEIERSSPVAFPNIAGLSLSGSITTRSLVSGQDRPLHLLVHELSPSAEIRWDEPSGGHAVYVWQGNVQFNATDVPQNSAVFIEHRGRGAIRAANSTATVLHFYETGLGDPPPRAGGHAHMVGPDGLFKSKGTAPITVWADSGCPTCELWLHQSHDFHPNEKVAPHYHTADEIIFVLRGSLIIGRHRLTVGCAVAIDKGTTYAFAAGPDGLIDVNFRAREPFYVPVTRDGSKTEPRNERELIRNAVFHKLP